MFASRAQPWSAYLEKVTHEKSRGRIVALEEFDQEVEKHLAATDAALGRLLVYGLDELYGGLGRMLKYAVTTVRNVVAEGTQEDAERLLQFSIFEGWRHTRWRITSKWVDELNISTLSAFLPGEPNDRLPGFRERYPDGRYPGATHLFPGE